jgi:GntR family transcriptional regulator
MTLRQALDALEQDHLIRRVHGRGTTVLDVRYRRSTSSLRGIVEDLRDMGHETGAKVLSFERLVPEAGVADDLKLGVGELAVAMARIRYVDHEPFGIQYTHLVNRHVFGLEAEDLIDGSLYGIIEGRYGLRLSSSEQQIGARLATDDEARLLEIPLGSPLVAVRRLTILSTGEPIELMDAAYRADLLTYTSILKRNPSAVDPPPMPRVATRSVGKPTH